MGKKLKSPEELQQVENNSFSTVVEKPNTLLNVKTGDTNLAYKDTQYDKGFLSTSGNLDKYKARQQPWYDQLGNSLAKIVPAVGLDLLETAGDIGELLDQDSDKEFTNVFTELAKKGKEALNDKFTTYQETPSNEFAPLSDSGWWYNMGDGLVTSIASFGLTGAGIGSVAGKGAKALVGLVGGGQKVLAAGQGLAQLGTASLLTHAEAVRSGANIYAKVKQDAIDNDATEEQAKEKASKAASDTYNFSYRTNLLLNVTSLNPIFKSYSKLDEGVKSQLIRSPKESTAKYIERLTAVETTLPQQTNVIKNLIRESGQEYLEETNTGVAEKIGLEQMKSKDKRRSNSDIYLDYLGSEEGVITGLQGALGGIGQTAGLEFVPFRTVEDENGNTKRVSAYQLEKTEAQKYHKETIATLKQDIQSIQRNQENLNQAIARKDKTKIEEARNALFSVGALKSIRTETVDETAQALASIASVDNINIGEDGLTDAIRQGLADNIDDNKYKETAIKKTTDLKKLNQEFRDLTARFENPHLAAEAFRSRMDLYTHESVLEGIDQDIAKHESNLLRLAPNQLDALKYKAEINAYDIAIDEAESIKDTKTANALKQESLQVRAVYRDLQKLNPQNLDNKQGLIEPLIKSYKDRLQQKEIVNELRNTYSDILSNPKKFDKEIVQPKIDEITKVQEEQKKQKQEQEIKQKREADFVEAKAKKEEQIQKQQEVKKQPIASQESIQQIENPIVESIENPIEEIEFDQELDHAINQISNLTPISEVYTPLTNKQEEEQKKLIQNQINNQEDINQQTYGKETQIRYRAQDRSSDSTQDVLPLNNSAKILHSTKITIGTTVKLRVDKEDEFYEKYKDEPSAVPIGIYLNDIRIGNLPYFSIKNPKKQSIFSKFGKKIELTDLEKSNLLLVRQEIIEKGEVEDVISGKTWGTLANKNIPLKLVSTNTVFTPKFLIGRNGFFEQGQDNIREGLKNKNGSISGAVYIETETPTGDLLALKTDVTKVSEEVVASLLDVLDIFYKTDESRTDQEKELVEQIKREYELDITTVKDLDEYFSRYFFKTNLNENNTEGQQNLDLISKSNSENTYVDFNTGVLKIVTNPYAKIGLKEPFIYSKKNTKDRQQVKNLLLATYHKVALNRINSKKEFKSFVIKDGVIQDRSYKTYNEYVSNITKINIHFKDIGGGKQSAFLQPTLNLSFKFMENKKSLSVSEINNQKIVSLPSKPSDVKISTLSEYSEDDFAPTEEEIEEAKQKCKT